MRNRVLSTQGSAQTNWQCMGRGIELLAKITKRFHFKLFLSLTKTLTLCLSIWPMNSLLSYLLMHKSVLPVAKRAETVHELDTAKLLAVINWLSSVLVSILPLITK
jgi:hypothetical protein